MSGLTEEQVSFYEENGYLVLPDALDPNLVARFGEIVDEWTQSAVGVTQSDDFYDLEDSHTPEEPRIRRRRCRYLFNGGHIYPFVRFRRSPRRPQHAHVWEAKLDGALPRHRAHPGVKCMAGVYDLRYIVRIYPICIFGGCCESSCARWHRQRTEHPFRFGKACDDLSSLPR